MNNFINAYPGGVKVEVDRRSNTALYRVVDARKLTDLQKDKIGNLDKPAKVFLSTTDENIAYVLIGENGVK